MGFLLIDLVTAPVLGVHWLAKTIREEAEREKRDEGRVRADLLELQERYDAGGVQEEEYDRQEKVLLERLDTIREMKAQQDDKGH